ncbi:hypothetical protein EUTSA_v10009567mg, partial [Eutrema salsugineum]
MEKAQLFSSLTYFFSSNGSQILDYQLGLQRSTKRGSSGTWTHTFSLCILYLILASAKNYVIFLTLDTHFHVKKNRTLSPMNSFSSELGMQFGTCLEAPHVIDVNLQGYYYFIRGKHTSIGRNRRAKKAGFVKTESQDDLKKGAAFLAVFRGK